MITPGALLFGETAIEVQTLALSDRAKGLLDARPAQRVGCTVAGPAPEIALVRDLLLADGPDAALDAFEAAAAVHPAVKLALAGFICEPGPARRGNEAAVIARWMLAQLGGSLPKATTIVDAAAAAGVHRANHADRAQLIDAGRKCYRPIRNEKDRADLPKEHTSAAIRLFENVPQLWAQCLEHLRGELLSFHRETFCA